MNQQPEPDPNGGKSKEPAPPLGFEEVLEKELDTVQEARDHEDVRAPGGGKAGPDRSGPGRRKKRAEQLERARRLGLIGLAFSGGGIRSATFNLGVLQALARMRLLRFVDYLSTVSGGGYIGSWLTAWISQSTMLDVEQALGRRKPTEAGGQPEPKPLRHLRRYGNYLTPRRGVFSTDTWTFVAVYGRNLMLNLSILVLALGALLVVPRALVWTAHSSALADATSLVLPVVVALLLLALWKLSQNLALVHGSGQPAPARRASGQGPVVWTVVAPLTISAGLMAFWFFMSPVAEGGTWYHWGLAVGGSYFFIWSMAFLVPLVLEGGSSQRERPGLGLSLGLALAAAVAGFLGGALIYSLARVCRTLDLHGGEVWLLATLGVPAFLLIFIVIGSLHVGLAGRAQSSEMREWWARLGSWLLLVGLGWLALFAVPLFGPLLVAWLWVQAGAAVTSSLVAGWIATTATGVLGGRREAPAEQGGGGLRGWIVPVAPYVFVVGLLLLLSLGLHQGLPAIESLSLCPSTGCVTEPAGGIRGGRSPGEGGVAYEGGPGFRELWDEHLRRLAQNAVLVPAAGEAPVTEETAGATGTLAEQKSRYFDGGAGLRMWLVVLAGLVAALLLAWRVDVNQFALHNFYRNRLARAYIDASADPGGNPAPGQPFTGLATRSLLVKELGTRPYHLINTALNLTSGVRTDWQSRKASSFVIAPLYSGYEPTVSESDPRCDCQGSLPPPGYHPTGLPSCGAWRKQDELHLSTAVATSGAAVTTSMGFYSSTALAFLLAVFNVRLGFWIGNTHRERWRRHGPTLGLAYLLRELLGLTSDREAWVYLSDGGHFENLGVYELVRRRCGLIIASDAGADEEYAFADLGAAIAKVRTDFGIDIEIDLDQIRPGSDGLSRRHCAIGTIRYDRADPGARTGTLVYIKASLTGDEPADVGRYKAVNGSFPHESTADQWFDEDQFESYRALGEHVAADVFQQAADDAWRRHEDEMRRLEENGTPEEKERWLGFAEVLIALLRENWYEPSPVVLSGFSRYREELRRLLMRVGRDPRLEFLEAQVAPVLPWLLEGQVPKPNQPVRARVPDSAPPWLPEKLEDCRAGYYFCSEMLQLMESIYLDLELERNAGHPDARGWMNIFQQLSWIGIFRVTFAIRAAKHGVRFVSFCRRVLDLQPGSVDALGESDWKAFDDRGEPASGLNFAEVEYVKRVAGKRETSGLHTVRFTVTTKPKRSVPEPPTREGGGAGGPTGAGKAEDGRSRDEDEGPSFQYAVGCALLGEESRGGGWTLLGLRVQDHLRGMGLERETCRRLFEFSERITSFRIPPGASDEEAARLRQLLLSSFAETHGPNVVLREVPACGGH